MTNIDDHADYEHEPIVSDELEVARRTAVSTSYTLSISPSSHTGTVSYELLLTEPQAKSVISGVYSRNDAGRLASMLNQYNDRNRQIAMARSEGKNFTTRHLASALNRVLENPLRISLPPGMGLEIILEKSG